MNSIDVKQVDMTSHVAGRNSKIKIFSNGYV